MLITNWLQQLSGRHLIGERGLLPPPNQSRRNRWRGWRAERLEDRTLLASDFGDAPDTGAGTGPGNYETLLNNDGPSHEIVTGLRLGGRVDDDTGTYQNFLANADDVESGFPNDEDGVLNPDDLIGSPGTNPTITFQVHNTTGSTATLSGWIDYNQDGAFDNATERVQAAYPTGATYEQVTLVFPPLPESISSDTFARFRFSTDAAGQNPTGAAADGEVEDYRFTITVPSERTAESFVKIAHATNGGPNLTDYDRFGQAVANLGDLDGDGVSDIAVGSLYDDTNGNGRGAVYVLMLKPDATVKRVIKIASDTGGGPSLTDGDVFGTSVTSIGDLDGDGVTDLAVGARLASGGQPNVFDSGILYVLFMNTDGNVRNSTNIANNLNVGPSLNAGDHFGSSVSAIGDLDGNGVPDLVVGAKNDDTGSHLSHANRGAVYVLLMNSDGSVAQSSKIAHGLNGGPNLIDAQFFGISVAAIGDVNGDGVIDLAVGSLDDNAGQNRGIVYVLFLDSDATVKEWTKIPSQLNGGPTLTDLDLFGWSLAQGNRMNFKQM